MVGETHGDSFLLLPKKKERSPLSISSQERENLFVGISRSSLINEERGRKVLGWNLHHYTERGEEVPNRMRKNSLEGPN